MLRLSVYGFAFVGLICVPTLWGVDDALDAARKEYALHFFSAEAHVNLAKQQYDHGDRLQAFSTLEAARRHHFEQEEFNRAFRRIFRGDTFDNSPQAVAALRAKIKASPSDSESLSKLADIYISREDFAKATPLLESVSKLRPEDFSPVAALAEIYERSGKSEQSKSLISSWAKEHPESVQAYEARIQMLQNDESGNPRALIEEALKKYPDEASLHFDLGIALERAGDLAGTRREFDKAVQLGPKVEHIQGWVARFYFMRKIDPRHALDLYLNVYFLNPDFYETEYAEQRIQRIAPEVAASVVSKGTASDLQALQPAVEELILRASTETWRAESAAKVLRIMGSEDETNRATAMMLLAEHRDSSIEEQVWKLLDDPDLCKRGMAAYLAAKWRPEKTFPALKKWLDDPAELVRFDAISALVESGPAGLKIVQEYARSGKETNQHIKNMMSEALKPKK